MWNRLRVPGIYGDGFKQNLYRHFKSYFFALSSELPGLLSLRLQTGLPQLWPLLHRLNFDISSCEYIFGDLYIFVSDINECTEIPNMCAQQVKKQFYPEFVIWQNNSCFHFQCTNLWGSHRCHCSPGYK